ncbi:MAG: phosphorylase [Symploca sp. SIO2E6]|nr:phosphorylase [Symploca sp. SIO2E6]
MSVINTILVPQGAEYQAVYRGLSQISTPQPQVLAIPIGPEPVTRYLAQWRKSEQFPTDPHPKILLMGLAGSLSAQYHLGDIVLYQDCVCPSPQSERSLSASDRQLQPDSPTLPSAIGTDRELTTLIQHHIQKYPGEENFTTMPENSFLRVPASPRPRVSLVRGLTSHRLIWSSSEKRQLGQLYQATVVDMEGYAVLKILSTLGVAVAMLRVISDDCYHDLPDLNFAISPDGKLQSLPLAMGMIRQPLAATRLIRGSLKGLQVLQQVTATF